MLKKKEIDRFIKKLKRKRPSYLQQAKNRAKQLSERDIHVMCPECDNEDMDILHVFPDPHTFKADTDYHVKCKHCGHVGLFTIL